MSLNLLTIRNIEYLVFQIIELICKPFGVKLSDKIEQYVHGFGFLLLLALLLIISGNDVVKIWNQSENEVAASAEVTEPLNQ